MAKKPTQTTTTTDPAAAVYKDRSGSPRNAVRSEGRDNFGAITEAARSQPLPEPERAD